MKILSWIVRGNGRRNCRRLGAATSSAAPAPTFLRLKRMRRQAGAVSVEFALIALFAFIPLLLGVVELGRMFYVVTTTQEVVRRAARQQVVNWLDQSGAVQRYAVFREAGAGSVTLPGGPEINSADIRMEFYNSYSDAVSRSNSLSGGTVAANMDNCLKGLPCIRYVRVSLESNSGGPVHYAPMIGWFDALLNVPLPGATAIMPAEALGLL